MINMIDRSSLLESELKSLCKKVKEQENIGLDLIDILNDRNTVRKIHGLSQKELNNALLSGSGTFVLEPELVFISLVLIALRDYDGIYYEHVRTIYHDLYLKFPQQKIEGLIRWILNKYKPKKEKSSRTRIINVILMNAIVPIYFLPTFFEFIYDIYKVNFEYNLPEKLYEEFEFIYDGLSTYMSCTDDGVEVNVTKKTYKLIKSTKQLILDKKYRNSIIELSIRVVNIIDEQVWGKTVTNSDLYFRSGYERWAKNLKNETNTKKKTHSSSEFYSLWEPEIRLVDTDIYIVPPIHKIKSQYKYSDIRVIVKKDKNIIYENDKPYIREIIGGYEVRTKKIPIEDPIGNLTYHLMVGNNSLYNSENKLYRNFIVFDISGHEIKNNTDYKGTAIFCYRNNQNGLKPYFSTDKYKLASKNIECADSILIEDTLFNFSSLIKPDIRGEQYDHYSLLCHEDNIHLPVFKKVNFLIFENQDNNGTYYIEINNKSYKLLDFNYTVSERNHVFKYIVPLNITFPDIYYIDIYNNTAGKTRKIATFKLAYDPNLKTEYKKIDNYRHMISIKTDLSPTTINMDIISGNFSEKDICFQYKLKSYSYIVPFPFNFYRLKDEVWTAHADPIWINDISQDTQLSIYGTQYDGLIIYSNKGIQLQDELPLKDKGVYSQIPIGFINSYKASNDYVVLCLTKKGKVCSSIFCYNKCIINEQTTEIIFNPLSNSLAITSGFYGKGKLYFEISTTEGNHIFKSQNLENGDKVIVKNLESFKKYNICFYEKGLMLKNLQPLKEYTKTFYARKSLVGHSFKIEQVYFNQFVRGKFSEKSYHLNKTYVSFKKELSKDKFLGDIYVQTKRGKYSLYRLNPIEIEICSDVIDGTMDLYMSKDGDGLLLDFNHHGIMNSIDDDSATDIFYYTITVNEGEIL